MNQQWQDSVLVPESITSSNSILNSKRKPGAHKSQTHRHEVILVLGDCCIQWIPASRNGRKSDHDCKMYCPDQTLIEGVIGESYVIECGLQPGKPQNDKEQDI